MSERIPVENLKPGMVIKQVTRQNGPVKIRKSGLVSSEAMVLGLAEMGVQEVEIDPDQTVEIAAPVRTQTQTQALLRGHHDKPSGFDHSLSEQFNRSLFLPSVQGLPSVWEVYARQTLLVALLVVGGVSIGFTAATSSLWWPGVVTAFSPPAPPVTPPEIEASTPSSEETVNTAKTAAEPEPETSTAQPQANPEAADPAAQTLAEQPVTQQPAQQPVAEQEPAPAEPEGEIINQRNDERVGVSPELLARFNKAVAELENEQETEEPEAEAKRRVIIRDDMQRVDQLPARLLTRLPTMSFSAHMYASRPRDRWVRVNGKQLSEGDWIDDRVQIVNIEPQRVILSFENEVFSMAALTDW